MKSKQTTWIVAVAALGYAILRWRLLLNPGITFDLDLYREWLTKVTQFGISQVYRTSTMDYPPVYAYILKPFGWVYAFMQARGPVSAVALTVLVKLPPFLFDIGIAWLLWRAMSVEGRSLIVRAGVAAAYLLNPAVLFLTAYWGGPDSIHSFFILACFVTVAYGTRFWSRSHAESVPLSTTAIVLAWGFLTLAALMKPLGLPYFPLLLFFSLVLCGFRRAVTGMVASILVGLLIFSPFLLYADAVEVFKRVFADIGAMPFTSSNAHNFWWLVGAWYYSEQPWIGPLTPTHIGLILFLITYFVLVWKAWRQFKSQAGGLSPAQVIATAAMVSFSFFMFSTHLHEHHLFATVPLMAALAFQDRAWRNIFICVSVAVFINCWLHDIPMDSPHWPYTIGGLTGIEHPPHFDRNYYVGELVAIWSSVIFNVLVYAVAMTGFLWPGRSGWFARLSINATNQLSPTEGSLEAGNEATH